MPIDPRRLQQVPQAVTRFPGAPPPAPATAPAVAAPPRAGQQLGGASRPQAGIALAAPLVPARSDTATATPAAAPPSTPGPKLDARAPTTQGGAALGQRMTEGVATAGAPQTAVAAAPTQPQFAAADPSVQHPSDFRSFAEFAGANQADMARIAEQAAGHSNELRNQASQALARAQSQANAGTPVERTAAYADYLKLSDQAKGDAAQQMQHTANTSPYEDALRGIYAGGQATREGAANAALATAGQERAADTNAYLAAQAKAAEDARTKASAQAIAQTGAAARGAGKQAAATKQAAAETDKADILRARDEAQARGDQARADQLLAVYRDRYGEGNDSQPSGSESTRDASADDTADGGAVHYLPRKPRP